MRYQRWFGAAFASSSLLVPFCMGAVAGSIASGRVPAGGVAGDWFTSWINPTSVLGGVMAITVTAYLAAVFMIVESGRLGEADMVEYFRVRAVAAAIVAGVVAAVGVFVLYVDADYLFHGLTSRGLPLVIASVVCGVSSLLLLHRGRAKVARPLAMGAVVAVMFGWGVAQWDYILPESLTIENAAAPSGTMGAILVVFVVFVVLVAPSIALLYRLDQKSLLEAEAGDYAAEA
jgi:cytochrome d ubiquinol oxidase subunit II